MVQKIFFSVSVLFLIAALVLSGMFLYIWQTDTEREDPGEEFGASLGKALGLIIYFIFAGGCAALSGILSLVTIKAKIKPLRILSRIFPAVSLVLILTLYLLLRNV